MIVRLILLALLVLGCESVKRERKSNVVDSSSQNLNILRNKNATVLIKAKSECGSGTIISEDGLVLTAYHLVDSLGPSDEIFVSHYKRSGKMKAELISYFNVNLSDLMEFKLYSDLAILKITDPDSTFNYSPLSEIDLMEGSDFVFWGFPLCGSEPKNIPSLLKGYIIKYFTAMLGIEESNYVDTLTYHPLAISSYINPGSSGSSIIDIKSGNIVGIILAQRNYSPKYSKKTLISLDSTQIPVSKIMSISGMGYAISVEPAMFLIDNYRNFGIGVCVYDSIGTVLIRPLVQ